MFSISRFSRIRREGLRALWALVGCSGLVSVGLGCGSSQAVYLSESNRSYARQQVEGFDGSGWSLTPGQFRLKPEVCRGFELKPERELLSEAQLVQFLQQRGFRVQQTRQRGDLVYLDLTGQGGGSVRLRVAILGSAPEAGRDLHEAILEHGEGAWGVHRGNLAVLGPIGDTEKIVYFMARSKLACFGELMIAGRDDLFMIPGGYQEL